MSAKHFFFAGGGTGGHIYPGLAVTEKIIQLDSSAIVHFFCSKRPIDTHILSQSGFEYTTLPAMAFTTKANRIIPCCLSHFRSYRIAKQIITGFENPVIIGTGGFVSAAVCLAGYNSKLSVKLLNVDIVPGRANRFLRRFADEVFLQFSDTADYFSKSGINVNVVGCPLGSDFDMPQRQKIIDKLGLDKDKKTLLITGASSGSASINNAVCLLLEKLGGFADKWQIVHLAGRADFEKVRQRYSAVEIDGRVLEYCDDMADLLAAADLVVGRSGAVSVAEYAAAAVPSICVPYPFHKDRHQYLNAAKLTEAGAAVIVEDLPLSEATSQKLFEKLQELIRDDDRLRLMRENCANIASRNAALNTAKILLSDNKIR